METGNGKMMFGAQIINYYMFFLKNKILIFIVIFLILIGLVSVLFFSKKNNGPEEWKATTLNAPWSTRDSHGSVVFDNKMWVFGGIDGGKDFDGNYGNLPHRSDIWSSSDGANWELITENAPWGKRRSPSMAIFQDKIWLIGGFVEHDRNSDHKHDIWVSENGKDWERIVSFAPWTARSGHSVVVFDNKLWIIGGVNFFERKLKNDVWYSEDGINWKEANASAPWSGRYDHAVVTFKDKLWLMGGCGFGEGVESTKNDIWSSENGKDWELVVEHAPWPARHGHTSVVFKDKIWTISGWNTEQGKGLKDVWYSENGSTWNKTEKDTPWEGREDHTSIVFDNKIWVLGGMDSNWEWKNDVWYSNY
jgi:leucine-zipper-like transcriptional regulator 1